MPRNRNTAVETAGRRALEIARRKGLVRPRDLARYGITRQHLLRLETRGLLRKLARGLYALPDIELSEHHSLVEATKRLPHSVICLLSALRFHRFTTQNPFEVWVAVGHKAWRPRTGQPPLRIIHMSGASLTAGVEVHTIEGVQVRVFNAAKTVADCFRFRNKIGLDVALEALREYRRRHRGGVEALQKYAAVCRVTRVMTPYLDALS